jgi:hypothetical protein
MLEVTRVRNGNGIGGSINFTAITDRELSNEEVMNIQAREGYHHCGYGFYGAKLVSSENGVNTYKWSCSASCD